MYRPDKQPHLDAEEIQAFLEGELTASAVADLQGHLLSCARCRSEVEAWEVLLNQLGELTELEPTPGFADEVMARVRVEPAAAPVVEAAPEVVHLPANVIQDFVEGVLPVAAAARVEDHLVACEACQEEVFVWDALFNGLETLPVFAPSPGFEDQVMARVEMAPRASWRSRLGSLLGTGRSAAVATAGHLSPERLQDLVEGILPAPQMARVQTHLDACASCRAEAQAWQALMEGIEALPTLAPSPAFADAVMARVQIAPATVPARPFAARIPDMVRRLVPTTRRGWAVAATAAMTPAVAFTAAALYVFTRPMVTPGSLVLFAWWKVSSLATMAAAALWNGAQALAGSTGLLDLAGLALASPTLVATGALAFSVSTVLALWVLYRNVLTDPDTHRKLAHVSA